jgi:ribosomal subunit interface protein
MEVTFKGRHTTVPERFRRHAAAKLAKLEKLDHRAMRIDVEVSTERNPRQSDHSERVELTIRSRGPAIRAEAAADDRYAALDLAFAKLEGRLRRASERRKVRRADTVRSVDVQSAVAASPRGAQGQGLGNGAPTGAEEAELAAASLAPPPPPAPRGRKARMNGRGRTETVVALPAMPEDDAYAVGRYQDEAEAEAAVSGLVPIKMEGEGPLVVREKFHASHPMTIDQALLEMELVGHDFFAYHDSQCGKFSVVYRRRGYDYGVIRLVEEAHKS